jgi:hypothetical protein
MKKLLTILAALTVLTVLTPLPTTHASFADIPQNHYYFKAFKYLEDRGIVSGYADGTARPGNLINRAELLKLVVEGFRLSVVIPSTPCFSDVELRAWFSAPICAAKDRGIVGGLPNGSFEPIRNVNKAEALKIIAKVTRLPNPTGKSRFQDVKSDAWFEPFVIATEAGNYLEETGEFFMPTENYTRGQIAQILYRIMITEEQGSARFVEGPVPKPPTMEEIRMLQWQIFALDDINQLRKTLGIGPLKLNSTLSAISIIHSQDMGINLKAMSHLGSLGEQAHERVKLGKVPDVNTHTFIKVPIPNNIAASGENVGKRNIKQFDNSPEKAIVSQHEFFMDEPDNVVNHRTTMLSKIYPFSEVGIGLFLDSEDNLWITEDFISTKQ